MYLPKYNIYIYISSVHVCMYVCMYVGMIPVCMYVCMYVCMCIEICCIYLGRKGVPIWYLRPKYNDTGTWTLKVTVVIC